MSYTGLILKSERKQQWLEDLRSGKFMQAKKALCITLPNGDGFCCLGVYARGRDIPFVEPADIEIDVEEQDSRVLQFDLESQAATLLPNQWFTADFIDLTPEDEVPKESRVDSLQTKLAQMNDESSSFAEIADWIEENL